MRSPMINPRISFTIVQLALGLIVVAPACAQPVPQAPQPEFTLKLTAQELDLVGRGLGTQPFSEVAPLIQKLRNQVVEQQKPAAVADPVKP